MFNLKKHLRVIQYLSLLVGLLLFAFLVKSVGAGNIFSSIRLVGLGFIVLISVSALRHFTRALAWFYCIEGDHRKISIFELFNIRQAGEAVRFVSFTGPFLGETSKAVLVRERLPMVHGMSSVITENLTYSLGVIFLIISGLILLAANFAVRKSLIVLSIVFSLAMLALVFVVQQVIRRRKMILTHTMTWLGKKTRVQWFKAKAPRVEVTEQLIHNFYKQRKKSFLLVLFLEIVAQFINVVEVYLILYYIGVTPSVMAAYIIETAMKVVNSLFFFVPGQVGVLEGGNAIILKALGMGVAAGVTLSVIEKIRTLFWVAYGLFIWAMIFRRKKPADSEHTAKDLNRAGDLTPQETIR